MEFPFGHHRGHHERREEEEEREKQRHPPPGYRPRDFPGEGAYTETPEYPPPRHHHQRPQGFGEEEQGGYGESRYERPPPPRPPSYDSYSEYPPEPQSYPRPPEPVYSSVQHFSHEEGARFEPDPSRYGREEGYPRRPPEPVYSSVQHASHAEGFRFEPNPSGYGREEAYSRPSEPVYSSVQHVSHEEGAQFEPDPSGYGREEAHHHRNPMSIFHHHQKGGEGSRVVNKPTVRVYSRAEANYALSILDGKVILARSDPNDEFQHWIKDEKYSTRVKDEEGFPSFALVNKATGQAIKHSIGATHPVQLCPYNPDVLDESVLWTESKDTGDGFRAVRMVNNIRLNFDAFHGDKRSGGVRDGTILVLWEWNKGDNQKWKIVPH